MKQRQVIAECDPLKSFKTNTLKKYPECAFFNHEINGKLVDISRGFVGDIPIDETIITDGEISLQKKNFYSPSVVWQEQLITLENGISISITIEHATFMMVITNRLGEKQVDIHVPKEDRATLTNVLNFFYGKQAGLFQPSSIRFTSPTILTLQNVVRGNIKFQTFDFSSGKETERQYRKKHYRKKH